MAEKRHIGVRGGGRGLPFETEGDAHRLAEGCKFQMFGLRVFQAKRQYFKLFISIRVAHEDVEENKSNLLYFGIF